jgi:ribosomal protein S18 acetylase RimI-like enzyme
VAEADGRVVGMYVVKGYRGKGIGKALMRKTMEGCNGKFEVIVLEVLTTNTWRRGSTRAWASGPGPVAER